MKEVFYFFVNTYTTVKSFLSMLIVSAIFIVAGVATVIVYNHPNNNKTTGWKENVGTICEITNKVPYVDHTVDNFTYEHCELDVYLEGMKVGLDMKIKYNPENPYEVSDKIEDKTILVILGTVFFTAAALIPIGYFGIGFYRYYKIKKMEKEFEQNK